MDLYSATFDIVFLLAIIFISSQTPLYNPDPVPWPSSADSAGPSRASSTPASPVPSVAVPRITVTPSRPANQHHKRKSVSFSLSSLSEIEGTSEPTKQRRPPTPFVGASDLHTPITPSPAPSPARSTGSVPSMPTTPMIDSKLAIDPMGVEKRWLMA